MSFKNTSTLKQYRVDLYLYVWYIIYKRIRPSKHDFSINLSTYLHHPASTYLQINPKGRKSNYVCRESITQYTWTLITYESHELKLCKFGSYTNCQTHIKLMYVVVFWWRTSDTKISTTIPIKIQDMSH